MPADVDLNADLGEGFGPYTMGADEEMISLVSSANIACGLHAGDPPIMRRTVRRAISAGVAVGAHPGYPDLWGFGRRHLALTEEQLYCYILYQLGALDALLRPEKRPMRHVKPHGALYNEAVADEKLCRLICRAVRDFDPNLILFAPAGSTAVSVARDEGLIVAEEAFADRGYRPDGSLIPRGQPGAVLENPVEVGRRAVSLVHGEIPTASGEVLRVNVDTICLHGDSPGAVRMAQSVRDELGRADVHIRPAGEATKGEEPTP